MSVAKTFPYPLSLFSGEKKDSLHQKQKNDRRKGPREQQKSQTPPRFRQNVLSRIWNQFGNTLLYRRVLVSFCVLFFFSCPSKGIWFQFWRLAFRSSVMGVKQNEKRESKRVDSGSRFKNTSFSSAEKVARRCPPSWPSSPVCPLFFCHGPTPEPRQPKTRSRISHLFSGSPFFFSQGLGFLFFFQGWIYCVCVCVRTKQAGEKTAVNGFGLVATREQKQADNGGPVWKWRAVRSERSGVARSRVIQARPL